MFSIEEIKAAESKIKSGADFPKFIEEIKKLGVVRNDVYVANGLSVYFDESDHPVQATPDEYPELIINNEASAEKLMHALQVHQKGDSDYFAFCRQAADAGVEKWVTDLKAMTGSYLDTAQNELFQEKIPEV
ncbi:DUF1398 domain-containing protein [Pedobacter sp. Leaf194]|uniref:DUF1398 domain-containing protein n=1 Tax=Pedobacter sp. Leaf194 TaxID=1736297 RepID=UPI0007032B8A|nr:DUF1398 family protein [Pedobacter sp. Leaf194]KQS28419.1 phage envelope protein [Pedobacter sp. Leaf194]